MEVFPHFILLDDDSFPQVYKTLVISKVVTTTSNVIYILLVTNAVTLKVLCSLSVYSMS